MKQVSGNSLFDPLPKNKREGPTGAGSLSRSISSAHTTSGSGLIKGASYSHTDLLALQSRSASPIPSQISAKYATKSSKFNKLLLDEDDDWASELDDSTRAAERRRQMLIKSIEHRPSSFEAASFAPLKKTHSYPQYPFVQAGATGGLRTGHEAILQDPVCLLESTYHPTLPSESDGDAVLVGTAESESLREEIGLRLSRIARFRRIMQSKHIDLHALKKLAWNGVPGELRPCVWQLLLGYLPAHSERRISTLARKRQEYLDGVADAWQRGEAGLDQTIWHQIHIDVPRTNPLIRLYQFPATQRSLERILYLWAIRHPASGYVQGINDLVTPFFQVFLGAYIEGDPEQCDPGTLSEEVRHAVEADSFWCLSKLLDGIQDNYIHTQPGIQRQVANLRELTGRIDAQLVQHLDSEMVEFIQFSFRWMNCLLMREMSVRCTTRMWDTYMAEGPLGFSDFHLYVCTAFLVKWSAQIKERDFQGIMMFIQALPTQSWGDKEIEMLLSEAFLWKSLWSHSPDFARK
ncbi:rab-GTPase-TBC domain-containing protein [Protomyces lactucae-debilis]|uniref:Rab-GTPase-TBC domain-containing protein n=1 Tax=Protomyces lactucae-debilis TaxID=2754530 RepID=A0A1Y2FK50_PROLT|nr:rab-GTPase-TBC domain-containing protein [Protomyces lactucae-debilis]ORY84330.1 rab-GTPase-TBC domain-containing protein [Protomyces lactucae-debilis]